MGSSESLWVLTSNCSRAGLGAGQPVGMVAALGRAFALSFEKLGETSALCALVSPVSQASWQLGLALKLAAVATTECKSERLARDSRSSQAF